MQASERRSSLSSSSPRSGLNTPWPPTFWNKPSHPQEVKVLWRYGRSLLFLIFPTEWQELDKHQNRVVNKQENENIFRKWHVITYRAACCSRNRLVVCTALWNWRDLQHLVESSVVVVGWRRNCHHFCGIESHFRLVTSPRFKSGFPWHTNALWHSMYCTFFWGPLLLCYKGIVPYERVKLTTYGKNMW